MPGIRTGGKITREHFLAFIRHFSKALNGNYLATTTRLLSMKRPDVFLCLTSANEQELRDRFDLPPINTYHRYWDQVVERIADCDWYQHPDPQNDIEEQFADARAAMLDAIFYL